MISKTDKQHLFAPEHRTCPGYVEAVATRWILEATGTNVIAISPTGCLEAFTSPYMFSPWRVPWIHPLFENGAVVASGIEAGLRHKGRPDIKVVVIAGDGATVDIGLGGLSGMFERGDPIPYMCYDNEAYINTCAQRCSSTPLFASTTTQPIGHLSMGKDRPKKNMPAIAKAHDINCVATTSFSYPKDLYNKVKRTLTLEGPSYIQVHTPCCSGWGFAPEKSAEIARLAENTGLLPLVEMEAGEVTRVNKIDKKVSVEEYLTVQGRFKHLFQSGEGKKKAAKIQKIADHTIETLDLLWERINHDRPKDSYKGVSPKGDREGKGSCTALRHLGCTRSRRR